MEVTTKTSQTFTGLTNGQSYKLSVRATNASGTSPDTYDNYAGLYPTPAVAPDAPTDLAYTAGNSSAGFTWQAPSDNGAAITSYTLTLVADGQTPITQTTSGLSATVTGLTNGTAYSASVTAINSVGTSQPSSSVTVTPVLPSTALTLTAPAQSVSGLSYAVTGVLTGASISGQKIIVYAYGDRQPVRARTVTTNSSGHFTAVFTAGVSTSYKAVLHQTAAESGSTSPLRRVLVAPKITFTRSSSRSTNHRLVVTGAISPSIARTLASLVIRGKNLTVANCRVDSHGHVTFIHTFAKGSYSLEITVRADATNEAGTSFAFTFVAE